MQPIKTIPGHMGCSLEVYENKVVIRKPGIMTTTADGKKGKEIWMKNVTGTTLTKPNILANGTFIVQTLSESDSKEKLENSVFFKKKDLDGFLEAKALIEALANK